jgi:hypothetical protein
MSILANLRVFIPTWVEKNTHGITEGNVRTEPTALRSAYLDYTDMYQALPSSERKKIIKTTRDLFNDAFSEYIDRIFKAENDALVDSFKCTGPTLEPLKEWLKAVTGKVDELDLQIMAQFLWQVKRKMLGKKVVYHIMPVVYGKQGGGKSEAIARLLEPLQNLSRTMEFRELEDGQLAVALGRYLVCFFDEMAGAGRADMETIKRVITGDRISIRKMYTQHYVDLSVKSSFIGASNKRLANIIYDDTGMRRFWEIIALPLLDWNTINSINVMSIWQGIDENIERGYTENSLHKIATHQQQYINPEPIALYVAEFDLLTDNTKFVAAQDMYDHYSHWCVNAGQKPLSKYVLGKRLNQLGISSSVQRDDTGKQLTYYSVNSALEIGTRGAPLRSVK